MIEYQGFDGAQVVTVEKPGPDPALVEEMRRKVKAIKAAMSALSDIASAMVHLDTQEQFDAAATFASNIRRGVGASGHYYDVADIGNFDGVTVFSPGRRTP